MTNLDLIFLSWSGVIGAEVITMFFSLSLLVILILIFIDRFY